MQRGSGPRITTMQSFVGIAVFDSFRAAWVPSGVKRWMSLTPARARRCSIRLEKSSIDTFNLAFFVWGKHACVEGFMKHTTISSEGVGNMGLTHVAVKLRNFVSNDTYEAQFLVDSGATDSLVPASELSKIGVQPVGRMAYELANGTVEEYQFGLVEISFMNEVTAGRVIFGPNNAEPILGVTALESVGVVIDPANRTLKRLPAIPLKLI